MIGLITTFDARVLHLLDEFVKHYKLVGVQKFSISLHVPPDTGSSRREHYIEVASAVLALHGLALDAIYSEQYDTFSLREFQESIRRGLENDCRWIVWADADEFHELTDLSSLLQQLEQSAIKAAGGRLIDRVAKASCDVRGSLWERYAIGCNLTERVLHGNSCKIVIADSRHGVSPGHHFLSDESGDARYDVPVSYSVPIHHFKWDQTVTARLSERTSRTWQERFSWWTESQNALDWLKQSSQSRLKGLQIYDFDDIGAGAGPFSGNPRYDGGPYWSSEVSDANFDLLLAQRADVRTLLLQVKDAEAMRVGWYEPELNRLRDEIKRLAGC